MTDVSKTVKAFQVRSENPEKDWTEDFSHENGNYTCICHKCKAQFIGHKRRITCRECYREFDTHTPMTDEVEGAPETINVGGNFHKIEATGYSYYYGEWTTREVHDIFFAYTRKDISDKRIAELVEVLELCQEYTFEQGATLNRTVVLYDIGNVLRAITEA